MDSLLTKLNEITHELVAKYNTETDEFNALLDERDKLLLDNEKLVQHLYDKDALLEKQNLVIEKAVEETKRNRATINQLNAQLKELQRLNPTRLNKVNKQQKATIADLKERLAKVEQARKAALKKNKELASGAVTSGNAAFHYDPDTKNAIRVIPDLYVSASNDFGGVPKTPVLEFIHHKRGITRQGVLLHDGTIGWAEAKNSKPTKEESKIARQYLLDWCKARKIKLNTKQDTGDAA